MNGTTQAQEKPPHPKKRRRKRQFKRQAPGTSPGTLIVDPEAPKSIVTLTSYSTDHYCEQCLTDLSSLPELLLKWPVSWINVNGLGDLSVIKSIGEMFHIHRLSMEDVLNVNQRPKLEQYPSYQYIVARTAILVDRLDTDQVSMFVGKNFIVTFQETQSDPYELVRARLREGGVMIRQEGPGYLAYALLDAIIDGYFPVLEKYSETLEQMEDQIISGSLPNAASLVHESRRNLIVLRRAVWPLREAINAMIRDGSAYFSAETIVHLRDCYDHMVQIIDLTESYRELAADLISVHLSTVSNKTNETMKVLTMIATIFMPLSFIAGVYGMNFDTTISPYNMPELQWRYGYFFALGLMLAVAFLMLAIFYRRKWVAHEDERHSTHPHH